MILKYRGRLPAFSFAVLLLVVVIFSGCKSAPEEGARNRGVNAAAPTAPARPTKPLMNYTVVAGDTLWELALKYDSSIKEIKEANKLESDLIRVGQKLKIPTTAALAGGPGTRRGGATSGRGVEAPAAPVTPGEGTQPIQGAHSSPTILSLGVAQPAKEDLISSPPSGPYFREVPSKTGTLGEEEPKELPSEINVPSVAP